MVDSLSLFNEGCPAAPAGNDAFLPYDWDTAEQMCADGLPAGDGCWEFILLLLETRAGLPMPTPHQDNPVPLFRGTRGGANVVLAGPMQVSIGVVSTAILLPCTCVHVCSCVRVHVPCTCRARAMQARFAVMLTPELILVATCRAHPQPGIDALGPVRRALRNGALLASVLVTAVEAAPRGADFCLLALSETERLLRMRRAAASKAAGGDSWRRALDMLQEQANAAVVLRVHRRCGSGAAVLPKVLCVGSIFDHSGCARAEVRACGRKACHDHICPCLVWNHAPWHRTGGRTGPCRRGCHRERRPARP